MRIVDVELVFEDGVGAIVKSPCAQTVSISQGEDVTFRFSCFGRNGTFTPAVGNSTTAFIGYAIFPAEA